jgi:hypothetical protein
MNTRLAIYSLWVALVLIGRAQAQQSPTAGSKKPATAGKPNVVLS